MVEGGMKCVKYTLFFFNLLFFLAGLGLIIVGAVIQTKLMTYFDFFGGNVNATAIVFIVLGAFVFIIGFFGCCGAYKENYCMTMTFAVLLCIIFVAEIAAGIAAYVMRDKFRDLVEDKMTDAMNNYNDAGHDGVTKAWDTAQMDFHCCGVESYSDWKDSTANFTVATDLPDSCCKDGSRTEGCGEGQAANPGATINKQGCIDGFVDWAKKNVYVLGGVGIGLAFIQIFGIILACCLARTIKKEYEVV